LQREENKVANSLFGSWPSLNVTFPQGDVTQDFFPSLFSTKYEVNYEGVPTIERDVVTKVASFGKQIGIISDALLELANGGPGENVARLRDLVARVEEIKAQNKRDAERSAEEAIDRLRELDPSRFDQLLSRFERESLSSKSSKPRSHSAASSR
jgi:hypothetical protein